jgi:hypothetical protein
MIRSTIRTLLRRQVHEATADAWADADLNTLIDTACDLVAAKFLAMAPDRAPITTTLNNFTRDAGYFIATIALPDGFSRMVDVSLLQSDGTYKQIPKKERSIVESLGVSDSGAWCFFGASVIVAPAPAAAQANGVRFRHHGGITLAGDNVSPPFPVNLHMAVVYEAKAIALGETEDDDTPTQRRLDKIYADAPGFYLDGGGEPEMLTPDRRSSTEY